MKTINDKRIEKEIRKNRSETTFNIESQPIIPSYGRMKTIILINQAYRKIAQLFIFTYVEMHSLLLLHNFTLYQILKTVIVTIKFAIYVESFTHGNIYSFVHCF